MGKRTARWARAHRARLGLTQPQLAETTGLSVKTIFRAERGDAVSAYTREQLTACLGGFGPENTGQTGQTGHFVLSIYRAVL